MADKQGICSQMLPFRSFPLKMQGMVKPNLNDIKALIEQAEKLKQEVEQLKKKSFLTPVQSKATKAGKTGTDIALYLLRLSYTNEEECENNFGIVDSYFTLTGSLNSGRFAQNLGGLHADDYGEEPERIEWYNPNKHTGLFARYEFDEKKFWRFLDQYAAKQKQLYWKNHIQPLIVQLDTDLTPWLPFMKSYIDTEGIKEAIKTGESLKLSDAIYELKKIQKVVETELKQELPGSEQKITKAENVFKKDGDFWTVGFQGNIATALKDSKGMTYIAYLLGNPHKRIPALELSNLLSGAKLLNHSGIAKGKSVGADSGKPQDLVDTDYLRKSKNRLGEIEEELRKAKENNDQAEEDRLEREKEQILNQLSSDLNLSSKSRSFPNDIEKARKAVTNAIKRALDNIQKHNTPLYQYLDNSIKHGTDFIYTPDRKINWDL
jgi:hypothetical protein